MPDAIETAISDGDFDGNGNIDLDDPAGLAECIAGPDASPFPPLPECLDACIRAFDFNADSDVDLEDVAGMQKRFTGQP